MRLFYALAFQGALALAIAAFAAEAPASPQDCLSCHKAVGAHKHLHGPAAGGLCEACHTDEKPDKEKHHTFSLASPQPDLCLSCHDGMKAKVEKSKVKHMAIEAGGCTACHDPHGSSDRFFLKDADMDKVCGSCHESKTAQAVTHKPVKSSCALCHDPHGSSHGKLLKASLPKLCVGCHAKVGEVLAASHVHPPVKASCGNCHDPHGAPKAGLLKADASQELCLGCHKTIAKRLKSVKKRHGALEAGGCLACHSPHGSGRKALLESPLPQLCVGCHSGIEEELKGAVAHAPAAQNACPKCHDPHGSDNDKLLAAPFASGFYNPFRAELYSLCWRCHDKRLAAAARTATFTGFRDGDRNLHFVHVNSKKGRSCKVCHALHAGPQEKLIRESASFGEWKLPIDFKKTPSGGTCTTGCHAPRSYERNPSL